MSTRQKRFLLNSTATEEEPTYWYVPLNLVRSTDPNFESTNATHWLYPDGSTVELPLGSNEDWYIINAQQTGYYRVNYDEKNWEALNKTLREDHEKIHVINRSVESNVSISFDDIVLVSIISYCVALRLLCI